MKIKFEFLLIFLLTFSWTQLLAQKCKFDVEKTDAFTNKNIRSSTKRIGAFRWNWQMTLERNGEDYFITIRIIRGGKLDDKFQKGKQIFLKLQDGSIIELTAEKDFNAEYVLDGIIWTNYIPRFKVDRSVIAKLSQSELTDLKVEISGSDVSLPDISDKQKRWIKETASCIMQ